MNTTQFDPGFDRLGNTVVVLTTPGSKDSVEEMSKPEVKISTQAQMSIRCR